MDAFDSDVVIYASVPGHPLGDRVRMLFTRELSASAGIGSVLLLTAEVATTLASEYRLRPADAVHLATAVVAGADRFITDNRKDFPVSVSEVDITYPEMLEGR